MPEPRDDSLMNRFDRHGLRRFHARDGLFAIALAVVLLVLFEGGQVLKAGDEMTPGIGRDAVVVVGHPANWIAARLPLHHMATAATAWLTPDANLSGPGGFTTATDTTGNSQIPVVTPAAFDPAALGQTPTPRRPLHTLLVTGDSMSMPLDDDLARALIPKGVKVIEDPHIGTGISTTFIVDWGQLAVSQIKHDHPNAVVVFIGANDGFAMPGPAGRKVACCSAAWAAIYANRVRQMMNTYRQAGLARVYWITLPTPREPARAAIARVVNAAITLAAQPWLSQVRLIDTVPIFTPGNVYRDAMSVDGTQTIVRQSDGIHLNDAGSSLLTSDVLAAIQHDFTY